MLWFILTHFVNSFTPGKSILYKYRLEIPGFPITLLDFLVLGGMVITLIPLTNTSEFKVARRHPAFTWGLWLIGSAILIGILESFIFVGDVPPRIRFSPVRNMLFVPASMLIGYRALAWPNKAKMVCWILLLASIGSAFASVLTSGTTAAELGNVSQETASFDVLRGEAVDVGAGDVGLIAACLMLFCIISTIRFIPKPWDIVILLTGAVGMFFQPHRSHWIIHALTLVFATFFLWPYNFSRKVVVGFTSLGFVLLACIAAIIVVESFSGRDFSGWVAHRLESLMPLKEGEVSSLDTGRLTKESRAWDTRLPGMFLEFRIWLKSPLTGQGFGSPEWGGWVEGSTASNRHTPWVTTMAETGLVGLAGFGIVIVSMIVVGLRMVRQCQDKWLCMLGAIGASYGFSAFFYGWMTASWNTLRIATTLGLICGILLRARDLSLATEPKVYEGYLGNRMLTPVFDYGY